MDLKPHVSEYFDRDRDACGENGRVPGHKIANYQDVLLPAQLAVCTFGKTMVRSYNYSSISVSPHILARDWCQEVSSNDTTQT